jgi:hypothetical protein
MPGFVKMQYFTTFLADQGAGAGDFTCMPLAKALGLFGKIRQIDLGLIDEQ